MIVLLLLSTPSNGKFIFLVALSFSSNLIVLATLLLKWDCNSGKYFILFKIIFAKKTPLFLFSLAEFSNLGSELNSLIDLLHKSGFEFEFQIVDGSHQIKTESQTSLSLAITPAPNSTDL